MSTIKKYIGEFESKTEKRHFGVRFATTEDAKSISEIMKDAYGYEYLYPKVYSEKELERSIGADTQVDETNRKKGLWGIAESIDDKREPAAICLTERRNEFSLYAGKTVVHNRFRGMGMGRGLGVSSLMSVLNLPENKNVVRLDTDVRSSQINSQKMAEVAGSIPYGFIPNYNNYADKRFYDPSCGKPFTEGRKEAVVMYVAPINHFWKIRSKTVILLDDEGIKDFYQSIKNLYRKMKKDEITVVKYTESKHFRENYIVEEDFYKGTVLIIGILKQPTLVKLLGKYKEWNVIEWRIPTIESAVSSQFYAVQHKFVLSGYDPGSYKIGNGQLVDTLVMCRFPNGVELSQFECIELTQNNKFIASKVINQLTKYYPACKDYL
ncbi:MAG: hypothetical protein JW776_04730 [Candidatus Lokiarchaeota archaeon]|nr:hypothetical protein [Candidatus Lokiarchaeota archaeon]